jgi:C-terminal processing protease CtpA/Prc
MTQTPLYDSEGFRVIHMHRLPDSDGFGFHIRYNKMYYLVTLVEPDSLASDADLRDNDVICKLNNQPAGRIHPKTFVQICSKSSGITLHVQRLEDHLRMNTYL